LSALFLYLALDFPQSKLSAVKLHASDLQTFLGGRTLLREAMDEETSFLEEMCLPQVNLCYRPEEMIAAINTIEICGSVYRETTPPATQLIIYSVTSQ
jgi:hypothetical protein